MARLLPVLLALLVAVGCAPTITYRVDTVVTPDQRCLRRVVVRGEPSPKAPTQQIRLRDYLDLPEADLYEQYVLTGPELIFGGRFARPDKVPADFVLPTALPGRPAMNQVLFRTVNLVLLEVVDYEERIDDVVERASGEAALDKLIGILLDESLLALQARYGADYDLTALEKYARREVPTLSRRLYARLWEIRRSRRGGIHFVSEASEWREILRQETARLGLDLGSDDAEEAERHNRKAVAAFLNAKLKELVVPRRPEVPPLQIGSDDEADDPKALLVQLQDSIQKRHGSVQTFLKTVEPLLPQAFGTFLINRYSLAPTQPQFDFQVRLDLPGTVVQTNGLRDLDGRLLWTFSDEDMGMTGYAMWARSLVPDRKAIEALGLKDFPRHLTEVERFYRIMRRGNGAKIREPLVEALRACVTARDLAPLETLIQAGATAEVDASDLEAAAELRQFLHHCRGDRQDDVPPVPAQQQEPAVEEEVSDGLSAPGQERSQTVPEKRQPARQAPPEPDPLPLPPETTNLEAPEVAPEATLIAPAAAADSSQK